MRVRRNEIQNCLGIRGYICPRYTVLHVVQGLADARKRARRSGLVQFFAVYQFDRGGILQMCHTVGELCNHAVRGSMVWRQTSDTIEFCILITCCILITA